MTQSENKISSKLTTAALTALGLSRQPFSQTISGDLCFVDATLKDQLSLFMHNLRYSDHIQLLKGPAGIGKTTLLAKLLTLVTGALQIYIVRGHAGLMAKHVLRDMLKTLGEDGDDNDPADDILKLSQLLALRSVPDVPVAIVIDDADQLPIAEFEQLLLWLSEISSQLNDPVKILLLAKPEIEEALLNLSGHALAAHRVFHCELQRYNLSQIEQYIQHHLKLAGFTGELPLNRQLLSEILEESGGIPRLINSAAAQRLNENLPLLDVTEKVPKALMDAGPISNQRKHILLGVGTVALVIVVGLLFFKTTNDSVVDDNGRSFTHVSKRKLPLPTTSPFKETETASAEKMTENLMASLVESAPPSTVKPVALQGKKAEVDGVDGKKILPAKQPTDEVSEAAKPPPVKKPVKVPVKKIVEKIQTTPVESSKIAPPKIVKKEIKKEIKKAIKKPTEPAEPPATKKTKSQPVAIQPKVIKAAAPAKLLPPTVVKNNQKSVASTVSKSNWLLDQNPRHYSVQLIASRERRVIDTFINAHKIPFRHGVFKTVREGKPWHVLVAGNFSGSIRAREAISRLPESVRANGPWVRSFLSIQQAISAKK